MKPLKLYHVEVYFRHKGTGYMQFDALENAVYDDGWYNAHIYATASFYVATEESKQVEEIA